MAVNKVAYRMRVYAARSVDATEATILTPAASASHDDEFKVASISGVSGYQPYLQDDIMGRRGRIDLLSRKLDIGTLTATLIDKRVTVGDNLTRWWTAFFGNTAGKPQGRLKVEIDECLDTSAASPTWTLYFTGELIGSKIVAKNQVALQLRERTETLKMKVFVGTPHSDITYAAHPTLLPMGFRNSGYGLHEATPAYTGSAVVATINATNYAASGEIAIILDAASTTDELNLLTKNLDESVAPHGTAEILDPRSSTGQPRQARIPNFSGKCRAHLTFGGNSGVFRVGGLLTQWDPRAPGHWHVAGFLILELDAADAGYLAAPTAGTAVSLYLYVEEAVSESRPLLLDDVDPVTLLEDMCAGKFGAIYRAPQPLPAGKSYGDVARSVSTNTASFDAVRDVWPTARFIITKSETLIDWVEQNILIPYHLAMYLNKSGEVCLVDLRLPNTVAGLSTLTDTDVVEEEDVDWEHDPTKAILRVDCIRYSESLRRGADLWSLTETVPRIQNAGGIIEETSHPMDSLFIGNVDYGDETFKIDARGYRSMEGEQYQNQPRSSYLDDTLGELAVELQRPFGYGLTTIPLICRRTATVTALNPGSLVIVDVDVVPDPATWVRGGAQLCRVIEYTEDGPNIRLRLVYLSSTSAVGAPSLAAPAQEAGNTYHGVTCAVTLNAGGWPVVVRYAVTATSVGTVPTDDSVLWRYAGNARGRIAIVYTTSTITIRGLPPGQRVWIQGRSMPVGDVLRLPSAWTAAAAPGYVDTAAVPAPTLLAATPSDKTCLLTWTVGAADLQVEILLATPTSDTRRVIRSLKPGTSRLTLVGLTPSTEYRAGVRHVLGESPGTEDTEDFTTTAASTTAPALRALYAVKGA